MTTDLNTNPSDQPSTFPPSPRQSTTKPGKEEYKKVDQVADHMAHKGAETEQKFDKENNKLFSK